MCKRQLLIGVNGGYGKVHLKTQLYTKKRLAATAN